MDFRVAAGSTADFMAAVEYKTAGGFTAAGSTVGLADFTAEVFTAMASAAASAWLLRQPSVAPSWAPDWAGLITLTQTRATTATGLIASTGTAPTPKDFTRTYSSATPVGKQFPPTNVTAILVGLWSQPNDAGGISCAQYEIVPLAPALPACACPT